GKRVIVSSRGQIWNAPSKSPGRIIQVTPDADGVRRRLPSWSADGEKLAYISDETGEQELAVIDAKHKAKDGGDGHKALTARQVGWIFEPLWAADNKHIAYGEMTGKLLLV